MRISKALLTIIFIVNSIGAFAWGSLELQSISGISRYCTYSDGGILTVGSTDLCPTDNSAISKNSVSPIINIQNRNVGFGALQSQNVEGINRYCSYSEGTVETVSSTESCPPTSK